MSGIGIVGGLGPRAGIDLADKVFKHTKATKDQDHIDLYLTSCPSIVPDRTAYLLEGGDNPAPGIEKCIEILAQSGATAVGVSCNTAHSPAILSQIHIPEGVVFVNMIDECCKQIAEHSCLDRAKGEKVKVGLLATLGTIKTEIYNRYFERYPFLELEFTSEELMVQVHRAIYDPEFGIKSLYKVSSQSYEIIVKALRDLKNKGCKQVILGCTELPLAFEEQKEFEGLILVDPTEVLACALIRAVAPEKLI